MIHNVLHYVLAVFCNKTVLSYSPNACSPFGSQLVLGHPLPAMAKSGAIGFSYGRMACLTQCINPVLHITGVEPDIKISLSSKGITAFSWTLSWLI